jgi:hypothetical protein
MDHETEQFYPSGTTGVALDLTARALPVPELRHDHQARGWHLGGMTEDERCAQRRNQQRRSSVRQ